MKRTGTIIIFAVMSMSFLAGCTAIALPTESEETTVAELGPAKPEDDFFRYVNEEFFETTEFEYGASSMNLAFKQETIDDQLHEIVKDVVVGDGYAKGSEEYIIKTAYEYFMSYDFENEPIPEDLMAMIEEVDSASSVDELLKTDAKLIREYNVNGLLNMGVDVNPFKPTENVLTFVQFNNVLNVPFTSIRDSSFVIDSVQESGQIIASTRNYDKDTAEQYGRELAYLTIDLYAGTNLEMLEADMLYPYMTVLSGDQLKSVFTNIDLDSYLKELGLDPSKIESCCVYDKTQLEALNGVLTEDNLNALKVWELGYIYSTYSRYIAPHYSQLAGYLYKDYSSVEEQALKDICANFMSETDPIYVERYYTKETDDALIAMCDDIRDGYRKLINDASWLSEGTRSELLKKLENIIYITGADTERHNNAEFANICGANYYELNLNYGKYTRQKSLDKINEPASRKDAGMPMQQFNACYNPMHNTILITCAITNAPFFDRKADYYTNLGGLGMVIAHEMGHAFDSNCILFNSKGEYDPSWIPESDMNTLLERNEKAVSYFEDNFVVFGLYHVDGEQTLGENYADLGAMECIISLAKTKEDREKLFTNYAVIWGNISTDDEIISQIAYDVHSPAFVRVNAVLSTTEAFYETYGIKEGDGMYIAPEDRISRWH